MSSTERGPTLSSPVATRRHAHYLLVLLTLAFIISFMDRQLLTVIIEPIKRDLHATDTQFSLLYGFAFAAFYTFFGLFFGRLVDTANRTRLLAVAMLIWCFATVGCGLARSFGELFVARMLLGIGEAALAPAAYALISDVFPPHARARAFAFYGVGPYVGSACALIFGGSLVHFVEGLRPISLFGYRTAYNWQLVFPMAAAPGIVIALLIGAVRDPRSLSSEARDARKKPGMVGQYARHVMKNWQTYTLHHASMALHTGVAYAMLVWTPAYLQRRFGWNVAEIGLTFGICVAVAGVVGTQAGGQLADWLLKRGVADAYMRCAAASCVAVCVALAVAIGSTNAIVAIAFTAVALSAAAFSYGPTGAALQILNPAYARGQGGAFYTFVQNLLGLSIVPLLVALCTGFLKDPARVGDALLMVTVATMVPSGIALWLIRGKFLVSATAEA